MEWKREKVDTAKDGVVLVYGADLPKTQYRVQRTITLPANQTVGYIDESVENLAMFDRPVQWVQHITFGPPFLELNKTFVDASVSKTLVRAGRGGRGAGGQASAAPAMAEGAWPEARMPRARLSTSASFPDAAASGFWTSRSRRSGSRSTTRITRCARVHLPKRAEPVDSRLAGNMRTQEKPWTAGGRPRDMDRRFAVRHGAPECCRTWQRTRHAGFQLGSRARASHTDLRVLPGRDSAGV